MRNGVEARTGGCLCGVVRYEVRGDPFWVGHCHCISCRKQTGAPVVTFAGFKADQVIFRGEDRKTYDSSEGVCRGFCGRCGTPLSWEGRSNLPERGMIIEFYISTFDRPEAFTPTNHVWYAEKIPWFDVADDLPRFRGFDFNSELCR